MILPEPPHTQSGAQPTRLSKDGSAERVLSFEDLGDVHEIAACRSRSSSLGPDTREPPKAMNEKHDPLIVAPAS